MTPRRRYSTLTLALLLLAIACGEAETSTSDVGAEGGAAPSQLTIYTSVTQDTVDAVVAAFEAQRPEVDVVVFRAPTGELTARIAAEAREGGIGADVLWMTDPLSIQQYDVDGILRAWIPDGVDEVPEQYRSSTFFGTRILNLVIVAATDLADVPDDWSSLPLVDGAVAIPDPGFAGSAFGALGYFASEPGYGMEFYQSLSDNGAVEVRSPGDVVNGVAEGLYAAGISLDRTVNSAISDGSPIQLIWPTSGAIAIYSPIAVIDASASVDAEPFVEFVLTREAQQAIADTGWQPIRNDIDWPSGGDQVGVDWNSSFSNQDALLADYEAIFGS